jgi:hypothetical protein
LQLPSNDEPELEVQPPSFSPVSFCDFAHAQAGPKQLVSF